MALADVQIRKAKPTDKPFKLADGGGLYLMVHPNGSKYWRLKYRYLGKEKVLAIGQYPHVTLADARAKRDDAKKLLASGADPGAVKQAEKAARMESAANSFEALALEWFKVKVGTWSDAYAKKIDSQLKKNVFPKIGRLPVLEVKAPQVLALIRDIEKRNALVMAGRVKQTISQVMCYAVATGRAEADPTTSLKGTLKSAEVKHMASVTDPAKVGELLRAFDAFTGTPTVRSALMLAPYVFTRIGELRQMKWADVDLERALWSIPAEVMKMREAHLVPLSTQAVEILKDIHPLSGHGEYVFTGGRDPKRPMSDAAINAALRRLGIDTQNELTGHGFRAMARTLLHERLHYPPEVIEVQLAHKAPGPLGEAYARAKFIDKRTDMMQAWANYLDDLKKGGQVIRLSSVA